MRTVWQIAAGEPGRDYSNLFLDHDLMFLGPGGLGDYNKKKDLYEEKALNKKLKKQIEMVRDFCVYIKPEDIILLRFKKKVLAIGLIGEDVYEWDETFDEVYGWDLQHTRRRVIWQEHLEEELKQIQDKKEVFADRKQIPTITRVHDKKILDPIKHLFPQCRTRPLKEKPPKLPEPLEIDQIGQELFTKGVANEAVDKVLMAIQRQRRLISWYHTQEYWTRPTEHEVVAYMVIPLLLALGWSEQLLAVEWNKVDLAAFWGTPTTKETCVLVCEAKGMSRGLQEDLWQAKNYINKLELEGCKKILLASGTRFLLYQKENNQWNDKPVGYLNIGKIRTKHIAPPNTNSIDTIVALTPAGVMRKVKM